MSVTEVIKNLMFGGWSGPPQSRIEDAAQTAHKLQCLEKDIPLPQEMQLDYTRPIFGVLCEDAVMFYTVRQTIGVLNFFATHTFIVCSLFPDVIRSNMHIGTLFRYLGTSDSLNTKPRSHNT